MPIPFACPYCGATGSAREDGAGRVVRCPKCQKRIQLPKVSNEAPPPRSPAAVQPATAGPSAIAPWFGDRGQDEGDRSRHQDRGEADRTAERAESRQARRRAEPDDLDYPPERPTEDGLGRRIEVLHTMRFGQAVKMGWGLGIGFWLAWVTVVLIGFAIVSLVMCLLSAGLFSAASSSTTSSSSTGNVRPFGK